MALFAPVGTIKQDSGEATELFLCSRCGVVVGDKKHHVTWHQLADSDRARMGT